MENNFDFEQGDFSYGPSPDGSFRWSDYTLRDESLAKSRFSRFFLAISVYLIVSSVVFILLYLAAPLVFGKGSGPVIARTPYFNAVANAVSFYLIAFPVFYLIIRSMRSTVRYKKTLSIGGFLGFFCVAEVFSMVGSTISNVVNSFISAITMTPTDDPVTDMVMETPWYLLLIVSVILAPIFEELVFRKFLMDKLGMYGDRIAIIVSAVSFAVFHGNFSQMFYALFVGFILAYIYSTTGRIIYSIAMHMLLNLFGGLIPALVLPHMDRILEILDAAGTETPSFEGALGSYAVVMLYGFLQMALLGIGVYVLFKKRRSIFVSDRCEVAIPKGRRASVIFGNAGVIVFIVISAITVVMSIISPLLV